MFQKGHLTTKLTAEFSQLHKASVYAFMTFKTSKELNIVSLTDSSQHTKVKHKTL